MTATEDFCEASNSIVSKGRVLRGLGEVESSWRNSWIQFWSGLSIWR